MALSGSELLQHWREVNKPDQAAEALFDRWFEAAVMPEEALEIIWEAKGWFEDRSQPTPDFLACVAWYGKTRLMLQGLKPPIVPEEDLEQWRQAGYYTTIEEFQERLAGVAGGFLRLTGRDPQLFIGIMQQQLHAKLQELDDLISKPLEDYTPQITEAALIIQVRAAGLPAGFNEEQVKAAVKEALDGDDMYTENRVFDRPFQPYEQLVCFEWGMEKFNMFVISEHNETLNLPNKQLHEALMQIDLNQLLARLAEVEPKLRAVLRHLAKHQYFRLDNPATPEGFWWRHWKREMEKRHHDNAGRSGQKPQRGGGDVRSNSDRSQRS